jgi:hypothetical protein
MLAGLLIEILMLMGALRKRDRMEPGAWTFVTVFLLFTTIPLTFICVRRGTPVHFTKFPTTIPLPSVGTISVNHHDNTIIDDEREVDDVVLDEHKIDLTEHEEECQRVEVPEVLMVDYKIHPTKDEVVKVPEVVLMVDYKIHPTKDEDEDLRGVVVEVPVVDYKIHPTKDEDEHLGGVVVEVPVVDYKIHPTKKDDEHLGDYSSAHNEHENGLLYYSSLIWTEILYFANRVVSIVWKKG